MDHHRVVLFCAFQLLFGTLFAQHSDKESFAKLVKNTSEKTCPLELEGCVVDSFFYQTDYLHEVITLMDDYLFDRNSEELKNYFADVFRYRFEIPACRSLYEKLLQLNGGFVIDITLDSTRRTFSLTYTPDELKQIWADREKPEYHDSTAWLARHGVFMSLWFQNKYSCSDSVSEVVPMNIDSVWQSADTVVFHTLILDSQYPSIEKDPDIWVSYWKETFLFHDNSYLIDDMADAGYHFKSVYENASRTDGFQVFIPNPEIKTMLLQASKFTEANDEQVETYIHEVLEKETREDWEGSVTAEPETNISAEVDYRDGFLEIVLLVKENTLNFNLTPSEFASFKTYFLSTVKHYLESTLETPYILDDTILVTLENVYQHLKGYRVLYIEENTRKALDVEISTEEIRNAKLPATAADETTMEKIEEQLLAEKFAKEVELFSRECPIELGCNIMDSIVYDYRDLNYFIQVQPPCQLKRDTNEIKQEISKQFKFSAVASTLYTKLAELGGGLKVYFRVPKMDSLITLYFTPREMREFVQSDTLSESERARFALNAYIENINAQLPGLLDFMTRLDSLSIEDGNLVFHHTILSQFEKVKEELSMVRWAIHSQMTSGDVQTMYQIQLCARSGLGMCFRYRPLSGTPTAKKKNKKQKKNDVLVICFSAKEIQDFAQ